MNEQKRRIFEDTLTKPYDHGQFVRFLKELLNGAKIVDPCPDKSPYSTFSAAIDTYRQLGTYVGGDKDKIALFSVCLKDDKKVENARSMQRSFIKSLLTNSDCSGALVSFYTKGEDKWRLSFVRMDYEFSDGKISEKLTPAKRYSYLVGKDEPCHTAMARLYPIFEEDNHNPGLDELEEAFGVEAVTKEFFSKYRDKYLDLKERLDSNDDFIAESTARGFDSEQFAKKLMGQIVFLYFIQKKGWLGVNAFPATISEREYKDAYYSRDPKAKEIMPRVYKPSEEKKYQRDTNALLSLTDEEEISLSTFVKGDAWGTGPKNFMRQIFEGCVNRNKNFFDDYLEPLFYTGLNQNRGVNAFFAPLHRRIPFLNGGLFEEMDKYDWKHNNFSIPNEMFSNKDTEGDYADGILDIFDRFNFTMAEDEPMEREVAIDPEMLGKVFENLLDVKDRKSKGAFYTPREIVHFMCQESLINYLTTRTGISDDDIRKFILYGEYFRDEDAKKTIAVENGTGRVLTENEAHSHKHHMVFDKTKPLEIPESILSYAKGIDRLDEIDKLLADVKVVDIAVGSGAFPLGMLTEIVKARDTITTYKLIDKNDFDRLTYHSIRNSYVMKRETIKNCIFACDIEASATDITKLRLWLSLVIDNIISDEEDERLGYSTKPRELPNLDCNIICGDSLMDSFHGIKLSAESDVLGNVQIKNSRQVYYFDEGLASKTNRLIELQSKLYDEKSRTEKESLKNQIQDIYDDIIIDQLRGNQDAIEDYYKVSQQASKPFILWPLYFPKVFRENKGFDIVIGNPPYIQLQKAIGEGTQEKTGDKYQKQGFNTFTKTGDIYCLFYEKGYDLLCDKGVLAFITSNKWMRAAYGEKLRGFLSCNTNPECLIDFAGQKIFDTATVDVNILIFTKQANEHRTLACLAMDARLENLGVYVKQNGSECAFENSDSWVILNPIEQSIKSKIKTWGTPLKDWDIKINFGIKTGYNEAFIISGAKKDELLKEDPKSAEIIRPILRGRDIRRYSFDYADLWLIATFPSKNYDIEEYPAIKKYLLSCDIRRLEQTGKSYVLDGEKVKARKKTNNKWFETQDSINYWDDFSKPKIMWKRVGSILKFCYDENGYVGLDSTCIAVGDHVKYLVAVLNTCIGNYMFKDSPKTGTGDLLISVQAFEPIQVPIPNSEVETEINSLLDAIISTSDSEETKHLESELDDVVAKLYHLNESEQAYIFKSVGKLM